MRVKEQGHDQLEACFLEYAAKNEGSHADHKAISGLRGDLNTQTARYFDPLNCR